MLGIPASRTWPAVTLTLAAPVRPVMMRRSPGSWVAPPSKATPPAGSGLPLAKSMVSLSAPAAPANVSDVMARTEYVFEHPGCRIRFDSPRVLDRDWRPRQD